MENKEKNNFFEKNRSVLVAIGIILAILGFTYFSENRAESDNLEEKLVTKVIDGDTIVVEGGDTVRLLGIDADELGQECYEEAKNRLQGLVLGKKVSLERDIEDRDQYRRLLRHIFVGEESINIKMAKEGLVIARFVGENEKYKSEIAEAEKDAMENKRGCKWK